MKFSSEFKSQRRGFLKGGNTVKRVGTLLCFFALCLFLAHGVAAQGQTTGTINGSVVDPDGKAVVGATVTITDVTTNAVLTSTKTNNDGRFTAADVAPGTYSVTIEMTGFKKSVTNNVTVITGRTYDLSGTKLEVGSTSVEVKVDIGGMQVIETQNTSTQATLSGRAITNLPFETRSAVILGILDPGAQTVGGPRNSTFEGLPKGTINITFDGINIQDNVLKSSDGFFAINDPRIDDVEEFGITTNGNDPSKTGEGAVQMTYVSKRGGNGFHGGVWETNRNQDWNSNYYFSNLNGLPRQKLQLNEFGYKIGGPILKDRLFFFTDFDFFQFPQALTRSRTILNAAAAGGVFTYAATKAAPVPATANCTNTSGGSTTTSSICTVNLFNLANANGFTATTYNQVNPAIATLQGFVESARTAPGVTVGAPVSPYQDSIAYNATTFGTRRYPDARIDFNATKNDTIEFDYHYAWYDGAPDVLNNQDVTYPVAPFNTSSGAQLSNRSLFVLAWRRTIGTSMSNELRAGIQSAPVNFGLGEIVNGLFPTINSNFGNGLPVRFSISGESQLFLSAGNTQGRNAALGQIHDTFSWTHGTHQFQFGFDETDIRYNDFFHSPVAGTLGFGMNTSDPAAAIFSSANFPGISSTQLNNAGGLYASLIGDVTSYSQSVGFNPVTRNYQTGHSINDNVGKLELGFFGGDSWRIRPSLTLNYGLRWEYDGPPSDRNNQYFMNNFNAVWGVSGPGNLFSPGSAGGPSFSSTINYTNDAGKSWYNKYYRALAPSVGLAWQPNSDNSMLKHVLGGPGKTVLRAGYSIAYSREGLNSFFGISEGDPGYFASQASSANVTAGNSAALGTFVPGSVFFGPPVGTTPAGSSFTGQAGGLPYVNQNPSTFTSQFPLVPTLNNSVNVFDQNLKPPMVQSWNAGIQRELTSNMVLEIRYQANHGVGLWDQFDLNETNVFENGFLTEFANAQNNLNICLSAAQAANCLAAEQAAGFVAQGLLSASATKPVGDFANLGLAGQVNVPVLTGAFTGSQSGPQSGTKAIDSLFANSTFVNQLQNNGSGSLASAIGGDGSNGGAATFTSNIVKAGLPSNYFIVNPQAAGGAFVLTNGASSTYNALIIDLRRRPSHGLQFDINYSFSKSLTDYQVNSSTNFNGFTTLRNPEHDKAPAPFDTRHALKAQAIYELPFGPNHYLHSNSGIVNRLIGGWEVNTITRFQTGQPVLITDGVIGSSTPFNGNTFNNNDPGINLVGMTVNQIQSLLTTNKTQFPLAVGWVPNSLIGSGGVANPAVFQACPTAGALCGKPYLTGPSFFRADISLVKTTKITERVNLEIRMEALNAFNDADFYWACGVGSSPCNISINSNRFGQMGSSSTNGAYSDINTTQDPGGRIVQLIARVNF